MNRVKNKILDSEFKKNIVKLTTGLSIAQLIPIFITPILTQFFSPEQFGVYGLFVSIYTILGVISSGKYDMAIMLSLIHISEPTRPERISFAVF